MKVKVVLPLILVYILYPFFVKSQNISGRDFWFTFPENFAFTTLGAQTRLDVSPQLNQLVIVSGCITAGIIEFPLPAPTIIPFTVTPGIPTIIDLPIRNNLYRHTNPPNLWVDSSETIQPNGFHITSDSTITVYAVNYKQHTVDGETILPTSLLGTNYVVMSKSNWRIPQFTITATQNNTNVTITAKGNTSTHGDILFGGTPAHTAGIPWSITLNAGQTYMVSCGSSTGSIVSSDKPIAVLGHTQCTSIGGCQACDVLMSQMLPTNLWGTKYITAQSVQRNLTAGNNLADYIDIIAGPLGASITLNNWSGNNVITLPAYGFVSYETPKGASATDPGEANTVITSDNPIQITQYAKGAVCDNSVVDPEAIFIYPENMWIDEYVFSCSNTITSDTAGITIVVNDIGTPSSTTQFLLDGVPIPAGTVWNSIGTSTYKFARLGVSIGAHKIENLANIPFGFYQFAQGNYESYIVQGGAAFSNCSDIALPLKLLSFSGENKGLSNLLAWSTLNEKGSDYFIIERALNGKDFFSIGRIKSFGNTSTISNYHFADKMDERIFGSQNKSCILYYRLKQTDLDGKSSYSPIISIERKDSKNGIINYAPNPVKATEDFFINYQLSEAQNITIKVLNTFGSEVNSSKTWFPTGINKCPVPINNLAKGIYFVQIIADEKSETIKLIIQ